MTAQKEIIRCNRCWIIFDDDDGLVLLRDGDEFFRACPRCKKDDALMEDPMLDGDEGAKLSNDN